MTIEEIRENKPNQWVSIGTRKPEDNESVIAFVDSCFTVLAQYRGGVFYDIIKDSNSDYFETVSRDVTHWMPLPEPPL